MKIKIQNFEVEAVLKYYWDNVEALKEAEDDIIALNARIEHVGGSVAKRPENPIDSGKMKVANIARMDLLVATRDKYQHNVKLVESFVGWCKNTTQHRDKSFIVDRFINQRSISWLADEYCIDRSMVYRKTDYLIKKYVNEINLATNRMCQGDNIVA